MYSTSLNSTGSLAVFKPFLLMKLDLEKVRPIQTYVAYGTGGPINGIRFLGGRINGTLTLHIFNQFIEVLISHHSSKIQHFHSKHRYFTTAKICPA
jgi:hypothetical protein